MSSAYRAISSWYNLVNASVTPLRPRQEKARASTVSPTPAPRAFYSDRPSRCRCRRTTIALSNRGFFRSSHPEMHIECMSLIVAAYQRDSAYLTNLWKVNSTNLPYLMPLIISRCNYCLIINFFSRFRAKTWRWNITIVVRYIYDSLVYFAR